MRKFILAIFVFIFLAPCAPSFAENISSADQRALALSLRFSVSRLPPDSAKEKEALYLRIMDECPDTPEAEEAYWELSNLYLDEFEEPKEKEAVAVLEKFLEKYDTARLSSPWVAHVRSRLKWLGGEIE
ncbi:hypothetical protein AGMMS49957_08050 [Synergistales bacterium]|nr:hypothetical protein AGMMS49957_08050 [Synergistales bacterium]